MRRHYRAPPHAMLFFATPFLCTFARFIRTFSDMPDAHRLDERITRICAKSELHGLVKGPRLVQGPPIVSGEVFASRVAGADLIDQKLLGPAGPEDIADGGICPRADAPALHGPMRARSATLTTLPASRTRVASGKPRRPRRNFKPSAPSSNAIDTTSPSETCLQNIRYPHPIPAGRNDRANSPLLESSFP